MKDLYLNGDVDFLIYGGIRFCTKRAEGEETEFWIEVVQQPPGLDCGVEFGEGEAKWTIYQCGLERFQVVEQDNHLYLVSCNWTSDWPHALHQYLAPAAEHHGEITLQELREQFCSEDPRARAAGLVTLGQYLESEGGLGGVLGKLRFVSSLSGRARGVHLRSRAAAVRCATLKLRVGIEGRGPGGVRGNFAS